MALRRFTKCSCGAHQLGICRGAQDTVWYDCEKLPKHVPNHQLGPYKPGTFAGSPHQVSGVPKACHIPSTVGIWTRHRRWHTVNGPLSGSASSVVPTPSEVVVGSQQRLSCGSISMVTTGQELVIDGFWSALIPYKFLIHAVTAWALMNRSCPTILNKARPWREVVFWGAPVGLPDTKVSVAGCLQRMPLTVARVRPAWPTITLCWMPSQAIPSTSCIIAIVFGQSIIRTISDIWEKHATLDSNLQQCEGRFGEMTT